MVAACSSMSTTTTLAAMRAGSSSCLDSLSAPTAAMNVPAPTAPCRRMALRDGVQVTQISLARRARSRSSATRTSIPRAEDISSAKRIARAGSWSKA